MNDRPTDSPAPAPSSTWCLAIVAASALIGLALLADQAVHMSTTYDEVTYLKVASDWWRTGQQENISRMGSCLTAWKLQLAPTYWALDRLGYASWVDDPIAHQVELLPIARMGGSWFWLASLLLTSYWARQLYGPKAMALAAVVFTLSPNLLAHGTLVTMEMPLVAGSSLMLLGFWSFLKSGRRRDFWATAALGGLAFSLKYTVILIPPILGLLWVVDLWRNRPDAEAGDRPARDRSPGRIILRVGLAMIPFLAVMTLSNLVVTGFATLPLSQKTDNHLVLEGQSPAIKAIAVKILETSWPSDWVGFANQMKFQKIGGTSYLFGERRTTGWKYYYPVTIAVKVPLAFWLLVLGRALMRRKPIRVDREWFLPAFIAAFLLIAMLASKRNFGYRYLLPLEVPAIVWASALATGGRRSWAFVALGVGGMTAALASIHPHELSYFNEIAGGPLGGRKVLADSNLDWGQGARSLARLQRHRPEFRDLTVYYFGDSDPTLFGVEGKTYILRAPFPPDDLPEVVSSPTEFLAVSASLQWGPWGPEGYFRELDGVTPVAYTDDWTIALYRATDLAEVRKGGLAPRPLKKGRGPG